MSDKRHEQPFSFFGLCKNRQEGGMRVKNNMGSVPMFLCFLIGILTKPVPFSHFRLRCHRL